MADNGLLAAFNDCVDRLHGGETLDAVLRDYPGFASDLRPMLETVKLVQRALPNSREIARAQMRGRSRLLAAMESIPASEPRFKRRTSSLRWLLDIAAVLLILFLGMSALLVASRDSLPGDALYGVKRISEAVRLDLSGHDEALALQFEDRRVDEVRQLMALGRVEEVEFSGTWELVDDSVWTVAELVVQTDDETVIAPDARRYNRVTVRAMTTSDGGLVALEIMPDTQDGTLLPEPTHTPTPSSTPTATDTPTLTPTPTLSATPTPTDTPLPTASQVVPVCTPRLPDGWTVYYVDSGDTLSGIAAERNITLELLMDVNCITDANAVVVGQSLYVPNAEYNDSEPDDDGNEHEDGGVDD